MWRIRIKFDPNLGGETCNVLVLTYLAITFGKWIRNGNNWIWTRNSIFMYTRTNQKAFKVKQQNEAKRFIMLIRKVCEIKPISSKFHVLAPVVLVPTINFMWKQKGWLRYYMLWISHKIILEFTFKIIIVKITKLQHLD